MNEHIAVWYFPALPAGGITDCRYFHWATLTTSLQTQDHLVGFCVPASLKIKVARADSSNMI